MNINLSESEIQSLKAQEAKDLAIDLLRRLHTKDQAPITAGQVQLRELQYGLKIKEAEAEDHRQREAHERRIKELELQIEQEKRKQAEASAQADRVRQEHAQLIEQVQRAQELLSVQLETATRENQVRLEALEHEFSQRKQVLQEECRVLEEQKAELVTTIQMLSDLSDTAHDVERLRQEIDSRKLAHERELARLDETFEAAEFEKNKKINQIKRDQELAAAELTAQHRKQILQQNIEAAKEMLAGANMVAVPQVEWDSLQQQLQQRHEQDEAAQATIERQCEEEFKRNYNITTSEVFDVTALYYSHKAMSEAAAAMHDQIAKLEAEITRMRQHIEQEPQRIAKAVEAAKVNIENRIEPARNR
jgi:hypothetical protein